jgi:hypothetical protein
MADSTRGKANLWRTGKDGASPGKRERAPGGGEDFQATANYKAQFSGHPKTGGGGANAPVALDNKEVFANSIAGLEMSAKPFMPDPGEGRSGLDMYSVKSSTNETAFGLDAAKAPKRSKEV